MIASESANVIEDVDLAEPSNRLSSASVELTAANFVKSACTNPETLSNKFNSAAVERAAFTLVFTDSTQGWLLKDK